jgi:hypothetical protein
VSTAGLQAAHHYIWDFIQQLQAAGERRGDILVQTAFENYTGSNDFDFVVCAAPTADGTAGSWAAAEKQRMLLLQQS